MHKGHIVKYSAKYEYVTCDKVQLLWESKLKLCL